jgi:hypothetical protein
MHSIHLFYVRYGMGGWRKVCYYSPFMIVLTIVKLCPAKRKNNPHILLQYSQPIYREGWRGFSINHSPFSLWAKSFLCDEASRKVYMSDGEFFATHAPSKVRGKQSSIDLTGQLWMENLLSNLGTARLHTLTTFRSSDQQSSKIKKTLCQRWSPMAESLIHSKRNAQKGE